MSSDSTDLTPPTPGESPTPSSEQPPDDSAQATSQYPHNVQYPPYPTYPAYPSYPDPGYGAYPYPYAAPGYYPWIYAPPAPRLGTWSLVSMIMGAISIVSFQGILAILAIIFGFIGLNEVKKSAGQVEGHGLAIAGLVMGFISLAIGLVIVAIYIIYFIVLLSMFSAPPG